eukprot:553345-Rhodomonas_salina.5
MYGRHVHTKHHKRHHDISNRTGACSVSEFKQQRRPRCVEQQTGKGYLNALPTVFAPLRFLASAPARTITQAHDHDERPNKRTHAHTKQT